MLGFVVWAVVVGGLAGALARLIVPGRQPLGCIGTILLGVGGSFIGGTLANLIFEGELELSTAGFLGSVIGAVLLLLVLSRSPRKRL